MNFFELIDAKLIATLLYVAGTVLFELSLSPRRVANQQQQQQQ